MKKPPLYDAFKGWRYQTGKPSRVGMDELRQAAAAGSLEPAADCSGLVYLVLALGGRQVPELGQVALMAEEFPRTRAPGIGEAAVFINDQNRGKWHHCGIAFGPAADGSYDAGFLHVSSGRMTVVYDKSMVGLVEYIKITE